MGAIVKSDTVASVSGTYNTTLVMTTGGMTVNEYAFYVVYYPEKNVYYPITSNTASNIVLTTPTVAYYNLTGKSVEIRKPSDYFGVDENNVFPDINSTLNVNSTTAMTTELTTIDLCKILPKIEGNVHDFMKRTSPLLYNEIGFSTVQNVILSMLMRFNRRRQYNKTTNTLMITPDAYVPHLEDFEKRDLLSVMDSQEESYVYDQRDSYAKRIYPTTAGDWHY